MLAAVFTLRHTSRQKQYEWLDEIFVFQYSQIINNQLFMKIFHE